MAEQVGSLFVKLGVDVTDFQKGFKEVGSKVDGLSSKLSSFGESASKIGGILSIGVTAPLVMLGKQALDAGSDLSESLSKSNVVFGDFAKGMEEFANSAAKTMGLSRQQALEYGATLGNLFAAMGLGKDASADMSKNILTLAADLASFNNLEVTDVLEKLRSGLVGEAEPLRSLGINISAAAVEAKALQMGLAGVDGQLSESAKVQARSALIFEQSGNAMGDFARTSDGLANKQRILGAEMANVSATLGTALLPIALKVTEGISSLASAFSNLSPGMQTAAFAGAGILAAIGPITGAIGGLSAAIGAVLPVLASLEIGTKLAAAAQWLLNVAMTANPIGLIIAGLAAAAAAFIYAYNNCEPFRNAINAVASTIVQVVSPVIQSLTGFLGALVEVGIAVVSKASEALAGLWQRVLLPSLQSVSNYVSQTLQPVFASLGNFFANTLKPAIESIAAVVSKNLSPALAFLKAATIDPLVRSFNNISSSIQSTIRWLKDLAARINDLRLPSWLTPGSPTPFEMGLRGIEAAMASLSKTAGLELAPSLSMPSGPQGVGYSAPLLSGVASSPRAGVVVNINVSGNTTFGDDRSTARRLAEILKPELDSLVRW